MAIRVVSAGTTIVKKITVGTPTKIGDPSSGALKDLDDVNKNNLNDTYHLRWDSASQTFKFYDFDSDVHEVLSAGTGLDYSAGVFSISTTGVDSGTYGSNQAIPQFTVNARGQIDSIGTVSIAGVTGFVLDDDTRTLQIETTTGSDPSVDLTTTIRNALSASGDLSYDSSSGRFSIDVEQQYTQANFDSDFGLTIQSISGSLVPSQDIAYDLGDSAYKWRDLYLSGGTITLGNIFLKEENGNFLVLDSNSNPVSLDLSSNTTDDLVEGSTNQYFTQLRSRQAFSIDVDSDLFSYEASTGVLTIIDSAIARTDREELFNNGIRIPDGQKITFCDGIADIFEQGGNFFIRRTDVELAGESGGNIYIMSRDSGTIHLQSFDGARDLAHFRDHGGVELYWDNTLRFEILEGKTHIADKLQVDDNVTILGNLQVDGTTTTINSTTLSVNDKNIVLADSAVDSSAANGAGITVEGANATITYNSVTDTWDLNKPLGSTRNHLVNFTTDNLSEGSSNLYYTKVRTDSDVAQGFSDRTTTDLVEGTNLYYTTSRVDSAFDIRLSFKTTDDLVEGSSNLYYTTNRVDSAFDVKFANKSTSDLTEGTNLYYTSARFDSNFSAKSTSDLSEGTNLYYSNARFDSALTDATSTIRGYFSASGDLTYDSSTGQFSFDVESVYTQANFDSDFNASLDAAALGGVGLSYNQGTNTLSIDSAELSSYFSTDDITEGSSNLYFTESRVDSAIADQIITKVVVLKDSNDTTISRIYDQVFENRKTQVFNGEDSSTILFLTNRFGISTPTGNVLLRTYADSDKIELYHGGVHRLETEEFGLTYYGSLRGDSAQIDLVTGDFDRSANTTVTAGVYGSASLVPVLTIDSSGFIDSAGTVSVAGVSSVSFDSASYVYTINTADGGSYPQMTHTRMPGSTGTFGSASLVPIITVNEFGHVDSISTTSVAGVSTFTFDSANATLNIGTADGGSFNARIGLTHFSTTDLSEGTNLYYTTARFDSDFGDNTTSDLTEGTNLYYTDARVNSLFATRTTDSLSEGLLNLYYTTSRADSAFDVRLATKSTSDLSEGTNLYYTTARFDSDFGDNTTTDLTEGSNLYYTTARADSDAKNAISVTDNGGDGSLTYTPSTGVISYTGPSASEVRAHFSVADGVVLSSGEISLGNITPDTVTANSITNTTGETNTTPTQSQATSDTIIVVDNTLHDSDFTSVEYTVHMDDSDAGHSQVSKVLLTYNKSNVFYTEYGVISSFTGDSDIGTLSADVLGDNIRLKFQRATGMGTVNVKPIKTIIK